MAFKLRNFTVAVFNRDVNQSGDLLRKYQAWSGYRARISALVGEAFALHPQTDHALVLAAGNVNDIDLRFMLGKLSFLTLSDADTDAMERGIDRQNLTAGERAKITVVQSDYTGAARAGFFDVLEARVRQKATAQELANYIQTAITAMANAPIQTYKESFPLVISCPVYTQLLYTQIEVFLKLLFEAGLYSYDELNLILNAAYGVMPGILACYNAMLLNACAPGGLVVLLSDMIEMETDSQAYRDVQNVAKDGMVNAQGAETLISKYGSELAMTGRQDFQNRTETVNAQYLLWPFDDAKSYLAYAGLAKNKPRDGRP